MLAKYEGYTDTIRKVPENYCLVYWDDEGKAHFDMDGATKEYRNKIEQGYKNWIEKDSWEQKEFLAHFVSEELK
ncbi:hypothetical protein [Sporosarcina sp. FSL W7-1283]|uniref:hypothetical protein n=1 Tax=Sporosarcina sp. FSL W7-1283 TaxID=2921560 RepID=UPI0030F66E0A